MGDDRPYSDLSSKKYELLNREHNRGVGALSVGIGDSQENIIVTRCGITVLDDSALCSDAIAEGPGVGCDLRI